MNFFIATMCIGIFFISSTTKAAGWQPINGLKQTLLWPDVPPDAQPLLGQENETVKRNDLVAGLPWLAVTNVINPTFTLYSPKIFNTGAAVVVFPGGGYKVLAIDLEGTEVCEWLTSKGITCVLLKYRVPNSGCTWDDECKCHKTPKAFTALQDAQRAIGLVRMKAADWGIHPEKIGVLGFSAGGNLVAMISTHFSKRLYPYIDEADKISARPDFAIALYPGHMSMVHKNDRVVGDSKLNSDIQFTKDAPPTFLLHAKDDKTNPVAYSILYNDALKELSVPVEMHLFAKGGHAFGLRRTELPITKWPDLVEVWLKTIKIID